MKVSYSWLKEFVDFKASPVELEKLLTMAGLSVASFHQEHKDAVYEIEVTSNRPDWLSVRGIAFEVSAITGGKVKKILKQRPSPIKGAGAAGVTLRMQEKSGCGLYCGNLIEGVEVGPSPDWLRKRLQALGFRCVNNVVDITNYCLLEYGQPLHAFDADALLGQEVHIRRARKDEPIVLIDGSRKILTPDVLVIADAQKAVAVAGVMGGQESQVTQKAKRVFLESAMFDPCLVRAASRRLGVASDSSYRFERGVQADCVRDALWRASQMILQIAGGKLISSQVCQGASGTGKDDKPRRVQISLSDVKDVLNLDLSAGRVKGIFERLGFGVRAGSAGRFNVTVPPFRRDIKAKEDLLEEVARIHGYDFIPLTQAAIKPFHLEIPKSQKIKKHIRGFLTAAGLKEVITYSLVSEHDYGKTGLILSQDALSLENPLNQDYKVLRTTLLPSFLRCASFNINRQAPDGEIYEVADLYSSREESPWAGILLFGNKRSAWIKRSRPYTFFDLKGIVESLLETLHIRGVEFSLQQRPYYEKGSGCLIRRDDLILGELGEVCASICRAWDIKAKTGLYFGQFSVDALSKLGRLEKTHEPVSFLPSSTRDISLLAGPQATYGEIGRIIRSVSGSLLKRFDLVESYQGQEIPRGQKALTVCVEYADPSRTLTDEEVSSLHARVLKALQEKLGVSYR